ncbi:MAG: hemagglutinin repeat-containing protein, partial [Deefgea sp.]
DVEWQNTQLTAGNTLTIKSGGDTNLIGATAGGKQIVADVGGNLNIESLQDISKYDSQQKSIGGSISVGMGGASGSLNVGRDKMHADYAAVNEQSGLNAGDGGFNIKVKGNTDLKGALITSEADASKNSLSTGSITYSEVENHAEYSASSVGIGVGFGTNFGKSAKGETTTGINKVPGTETPGDGIKANTPIIMGASGKDSSTTHSGIAAGTITITNEAQQLQLTGKTVEETLASLNRDTSNTSGKLENNFDKAKIEEAFTVTKAFINETGTFMANRAKEADAAKDAVKEAKEKEAKAENAFNQANNSGNAEAIKAADANYKNAQIATYNTQSTLVEAEKWGPGGTYGQAMTIFQTAVGGNVTGGMSNLIQNAAVGYLQSLAVEQVKEIADSFEKIKGVKDETSESVRTALHAIVGCAGAAATGQSCSS